MIRSIVLMAVREIRRNLMRSCLTVLGIVIGVAAVIVIVTLGAGTTEQVAGEIGRLGSNMVTVSPGSMMRSGSGLGAPPFDTSDFTAIQREVTGVTAIAPVSMRQLSVVVGNESRRVNVMGTDAEFSVVRNWKIVEGRNFTAGEVLAGSPVAIIGMDIKDKMFAGQPPLGATIRVGKVAFEVIGVLEAKGQAIFGGSQDETVVVPLRTFQRRLTGSNKISQIYLSAESENALADVKNQIYSVMREQRKIMPGDDDNFMVQDMAEVSNMMATTIGVLTAFLSAIAAVSLLVGGVGIMNIMLVSVTERTREIGIRLAIGATERDVMLQFLIEACLLSAGGGLVGIAIGLGAAALATPAMNVPFVWQPSVILLAFSFSVAVGVIFGFVPARRAARLNPIEALRHE